MALQIRELHSRNHSICLPRHLDSLPISYTGVTLPTAQNGMELIKEIVGAVSIFNISFLSNQPSLLFRFHNAFRPQVMFPCAVYSIYKGESNKGLNFFFFILHCCNLASW